MTTAVLDELVAGKTDTRLPPGFDLLPETSVDPSSESDTEAKREAPRRKACRRPRTNRPATGKESYPDAPASEPDYFVTDQTIDLHQHQFQSLNIDYYTPSLNYPSLNGYIIAEANDSHHQDNRKSLLEREEDDIPFADDSEKENSGQFEGETDDSKIKEVVENRTGHQDSRQNFCQQMLQLDGVTVDHSEDGSEELRPSRTQRNRWPNKVPTSYPENSGVSQITVVTNPWNMDPPHKSVTSVTNPWNMDPAHKPVTSIANDQKNSERSDKTPDGKGPNFFLSDPQSQSSCCCEMELQRTGLHSLTLTSLRDEEQIFSSLPFFTTSEKLPKNYLKPRKNHTPEKKDLKLDVRPSSNYNSSSEDVPRNQRYTSTSRKLLNTVIDHTPPPDSPPPPPPLSSPPQPAEAEVKAVLDMFDKSLEDTWKDTQDDRKFLVEQKDNLIEEIYVSSASPTNSSEDIDTIRRRNVMIDAEVNTDFETYVIDDAEDDDFILDEVDSLERVSPPIVISRAQVVNVQPRPEINAENPTSSPNSPRNVYRDSCLTICVVAEPQEQAEKEEKPKKDNFEVQHKIAARVSHCAKEENGVEKLEETKNHRSSLYEVRSETKQENVDTKRYSYPISKEPLLKVESVKNESVGHRYIKNSVATRSKSYSAVSEEMDKKSNQKNKIAIEKIKKSHKLSLKSILTTNTKPIKNAAATPLKPEKVSRPEEANNILPEKLRSGSPMPTGVSNRRNGKPKPKYRERAIDVGDAEAFPLDGADQPSGDQRAKDEADTMTKEKNVNRTAEMNRKADGEGGRGRRQEGDTGAKENAEREKLNQTKPNDLFAVHPKRVTVSISETPSKERQASLVNVDVHQSVNSAPSAIDDAVVASDNYDTSQAGLPAHHHQSHFVVVAIDFGTTYSGYAFCFTRDPESIHIMRKWEGGDPGLIHQKIPTCLLLTPKSYFHSFGFTARDSFHDMDPQEAKQWLYFEKFKMTLHHNKDLNRETQLLAANGKTMPAITIFAEALRYFRDHALQELSDQSATKILNEDVRWVITVPAIWRQPAKQFMRQAAYEAGIASPEYPDQLLIALEPEAASIYCRKLRMNQLVPEGPEAPRFCLVPKPEPPPTEQNAAAAITEGSEGMQYMVVDCGGGTVDITVHEMADKTGTLRELYKATGGPYGSVGVDHEFEKLLGDIFGKDFIEQFKQKRAASFVHLMIYFECRKRSASPYKTTPLNISLPFPFINYYKQYTKQKETVESAIKKFGRKDIRWSDQGMLRIEPQVMIELFQPVVNNIRQHITNVLNGVNNRNIRYLFLVGGFAESQILQAEIRKSFGKELQVIIPQGMSLAILRGAVLFGLDPAIVSVRRARMTYGVGVLNKFIPGHHPPSKCITRGTTKWCTDVFDKFVYMDQSVGLGDTVLRSYTPANAGQKQIVLHIYCSESDQAEYVTDPGVHRCGTLRLDLSDSQYVPMAKRREIQMRMTFGGTEIKVSALDVATQKIVRAQIDFLNQ